ncbi:MAG: glutamine synthetase family protein [Ruminococcus sp.]|nr:glutamine synthetase family protein [Ruminococcus sp.]
MKYTVEEVMQYVEEEDVKFIRLAFCDIFGRQKNVSIMPGELKRAFEQGIAFDASAIRGFGRYTRSDLFLYPDPDTLSVLPWRPEKGRVVRMYCTIAQTSFVPTPECEPFECCTRTLLRRAAETAAKEGAELLFGSRAEFYLYGADEDGRRTNVPFDNAGYMDIAPLDRGEDVRRQIALTLERMGICAESSCHIEGSGQNAVKLVRTGMPRAADDLMSFFTVIKTAASANGLCAELSPKPIADMHGSGLSIEMSAGKDTEKLRHAAAGIAAHLPEITLFLDPTRASYERLRGLNKRAMRFDNTGGSATLCTPDCTANPYLVYALLIYAALDGIKNGTEYNDTVKLPESFEEAAENAKKSGFIRELLPELITEIYCTER